MSNQKTSVGVIFGSRSVEHDVSIVSATQVMKALSTGNYEVVPIYISRKGEWFTGENLTSLRNFDISDISDLVGVKNTVLSSNIAYGGIITPPLAGRLAKNDLLKLDVLFPVIHGSHGEDGTLQGLFEMVDLPYVGAGVLASAIANDKLMTKTVLKGHGLPVIEPYLGLSRQQWLSNRDALLKKVSVEIGYPAFVKPVTLGSSIGIARVEDAEQAALHIDIAINLDQRVLIEKAAHANGETLIEINCAVMGNDEVRASTLEQPVSYEEFLTYEEKYMREGGGTGMKGQERIIPAPLDEALTPKIRQAGVDAFQAIQGQGTARIDFLVAPESGKFWVNEINTMPGSLAFYLWEPDGMNALDVCETLIQLAIERHNNKQAITYDYKSGLLSHAAARGAKSGK